MRNGVWRWAAVLLAAGCCGALWGCDAREALVTVESEKEALVIQSALEGRGVPGVEKSPSAARRGGAWDVTVPVEVAVRARAALVELDLPREKRAGLAEMAQGFGLVPSPAQERARVMAALAGELSTTLEAIDGVVSARVHVSPAREADLDGAGAEPGTAVVLVKYVPGGDRATVARGDGSAAGAGGPADAPVTAEMVRGMVVKAVPGVEAARVDVVFTRARNAPAVDEAGGGFSVSMVKQWRVWIGVLVTLAAALLAYTVVAARQFFRGRRARAS